MHAQPWEIFKLIFFSSLLCAFAASISILTRSSGSAVSQSLFAASLAARATFAISKINVVGCVSSATLTPIRKTTLVFNVRPGGSQQSM